MGSDYPDSLLSPGFRLDRYELLCVIGKGGMASVWLARLRGVHGFERLAALKTIRPEHASDAVFRRMFLDEARIASGIDHPNVARILDLGEYEGIPYLVMEYVQGDSLQRLRKSVEEASSRIPWEITARILADACAGLHAVHELRDPEGSPLGIIHRDVSPQNILISESGIAKIIDFGVAKARGRLSGETETGVTKGKIRYMAPEQALGTELDRRADLWSIGAVAYELLAGVPPFDGPNDVARLRALLSEGPPKPLPDTVPPALREVVQRALSWNVPERYTSALDLRLALERAMLAAGKFATAEDVAAFATRHLGGRAEARRQQVERAIADVNARAARGELPSADPSQPNVSEPPEPTGPTGGSSRRRHLAGPGAADAAEDATALGSVLVTFAPPHPRTRLSVLAAAATLLVVLAVLVTLRVRSSSASGAASVAAASTSTTSTAEHVAAPPASVVAKIDPFDAAAPTASSVPAPGSVGRTLAPVAAPRSPTAAPRVRRQERHDDDTIF